MPRLFAGLEIPADAVEKLSWLRGGLPGARFLDPGNYHLTLRFIGDVDGATAHDVDAALADIRTRLAVPVTFDALDTFGGDRPHALIVRARPDRALLELQAEIERALRRAGLEPERRKFVPHVTLARLRQVAPRDVAALIAGRGRFVSFGFEADRVALFSAREGVGGGPYIVEAEYPFSGMSALALR
ncbi:MAG: RNA 2',3'-cyclic phosphodiesterase [Salinarimonadaceae bacterium]|nr:MAG: RNA 2',3'-cyclic phosphodiesterase [Salinarimonadaceae bacterium]